MNSLFFKKKKSFSRFGNLLIQKKMIEENYPFLTCNIVREVLTCTGWVQPDGCLDKYKIKIECVAGCEPKSTIISPKIEPSPQIHMYSDHSICLHYPPDMWWNEKIKIYEYTIPWIIEWIIFYELYLINGNKWEGRESPTHITESDKNVSKNID
jgi:hypothetical protein